MNIPDPESLPPRLGELREALAQAVVGHGRNQIAAFPFARAQIGGRVFAALVLLDLGGLRNQRADAGSLGRQRRLGFGARH